MTRPILIVGALALAACNPPADNTAVAPATNNPAVAVLTPELGAPDYSARAAAGDMLEVQSSKVALERSGAADVKAFATMMVQDHAKSSADMKAALASAGLNIAPPATLPADMQGRVNDLTAVDAAEFDSRYMDMQVQAHEAALDLHTRYAGGGDNAQLKALAAATAAKVQQHLDHARTLRDSLK